MGVQILRLEGHGGERWSADALADDEWWEHVTTVRVEAEASDTEGHGSSSIVSVVAYAGDDVEGHAITLRFSTAGEAQHFRRLIAASVIVAPSANRCWFGLVMEICGGKLDTTVTCRCASELRPTLS